MAQSKTTIELNGTLYDATTGAVVEEVSSTPVVQNATKPAPRSTGVNMDGFVRRSPTSTVTKPLAVTPAQPVAAKKPRPESPAAPVHKPEKSKTLMRHAVAKPAPSPKKTTAKATAKKTNEVVRPDTLTQERLRRAQQAPKSAAISRFGLLGNKNVEPTIAHLPVQPHPDSTTNASEAFPTPVSQAAQRHATPQQTSSDAFNAALVNADSHAKHRLKSPSLRHKVAKKIGVSSKVVTIVAASFAFLVLGGIIAYENVPNVSMHLASVRAGFRAAIPDYTPSGFSLDNQINTAPGQVTLNFHSNADNRTFQVTQQPSNWTSASLLANYVQPKQQNYQIVQDKGRTLYIVDGTTTWVNGGIWYQVKGDADLSNDQLSHIADSL